MVSKTFLFLAFALAAVLFITSQMAEANDLASNHDSEVEEAKYGVDHDDDGGYYNGGGRGGYYNGGGNGRYNGGGGGYNRGRGRGRGYCRYGCCGGGRYYNRGCRCCATSAEAIAYKQAQTHD